MFTRTAIWMVLTVLSVGFFAADAVVYYFMIQSRFVSEIDMFSLGVIAGKAILVPLGLYFFGVVAYSNFL